MINSPGNQYTTNQDGYPAPSPTIGSQFDIPAFIQNIGARKQQLALNRAQREAINQRKFQQNYDPNKLIPKEINQWNADEISAEIDALTKAKIDTAAKGGDVDGALAGQFSAGHRKINELETYGKVVTDAVKLYVGKMAQDPGKYDIDEYNKWLAGLKEQPTAKSRAEYVQSNQPFTEQIDILETFKDWIPDETTFETAGGVTTTKLDQDKLKQTITSRLTTLPPERQKKILMEAMEMTDPATGKPLATDFPSLIDGITRMLMPLGKESTTRVGNTGSGSSGAGGVSEKLSMSVGTDDTPGLSKDGNPNVVTVTRTGTNDNLPPIGVTNDKGELIDFQPIKFVAGEDGKIGAYGWRIVPGESVPFPSDGSEAEKAAWYTTNGKTPKKMEAVWVDYDTNENEFLAQTGTDMYKKMGRKRGSKAPTTSFNTEIDPN